MPEIPRDSSPDATIALLRQGYRFISDRCRSLRTDVFETRLLLRPTICFLGSGAARVFYDTEHIKRRGAMPGRIQESLLGRGSVQGLDGMAHRQRKDMFMSLMQPERIDQLAELAHQEWRAALQRWRRVERVKLLDEGRKVFCRAVCHWSGVPLAESEVGPRTHDFADMIDGGGAIGPRYWRSQRARKRGERWAQALIREARGGRLEPEPESALAAIAFYRGVDGRLLDPRAAAVDLLNVLRPTVAIATYVTFAALALHRFPECRPVFGGGSRDLQHFVNEVRRFFPFFPFAAGVVAKAFEWRGYPFPRDRRVLLDLYGTNHDARLWDSPDTFFPERFEQREVDAFALVPQGGGDPYVHHRCAGEWITITLMKDAVEFLMGEAEYRVPEQDLSIDLGHMPATPKSGFVIEALPPGSAGKRGRSPASSGAAPLDQKPH